MLSVCSPVVDFAQINPAQLQYLSLCTELGLISFDCHLTGPPLAAGQSG